MSQERAAFFKAEVCQVTAIIMKTGNVTKVNLYLTFIIFCIFISICFVYSIFVSRTIYCTSMPNYVTRLCASLCSVPVRQII
jgi:hypothetical protein